MRFTAAANAATAAAAVVPAGPIPALDPPLLALLAGILAAFGLAVTRRR